LRRLFTTAESGLTPDALRWAVRRGDCTRIERGVYGEGGQRPSRLDRERARVIAARSTARGGLAGVLLGLDSVALDGHPMRDSEVPPERLVVVDGISCAGGLQTLLDLATVVDDDTWEQALESALRLRLTTIAELEALPRLPARVRRVLARRPAGAPPTESLLETLTVQLARGVPGLEDLVRQHEVHDRHGGFVARVDLCQPDLGLFFELDGQHHDGQPVHDARRETAVVAATGWLPGRFTWHEVVHIPRTTRRRFADLVREATARPVPAATARTSA
jgi:hypothetical protein